MAERKKHSIKAWFREMKSELKKVVWPTWNQVYKNTWVVLIVCAVFAVLITLMDLVLSLGINQLLKI